MSPEGVVTAFGLSPANSDERPIDEYLLRSDGYDAFLADKGFSSLAWERRWLEEYGALVAATPQKSAKRAWPERACRWAASKRQIIEGVIWQLKDLFGLERHRAKVLGGLLTRLAAKVAAYTCGQVLNAASGRPLRSLASLLISTIAHQRSWDPLERCRVSRRGWPREGARKGPRRTRQGRPAAGPLVRSPASRCGEDECGGYFGGRFGHLLSAALVAFAMVAPTAMAVRGSVNGGRTSGG